MRFGVVGGRHLFGNAPNPQRAGVARQNKPASDPRVHAAARFFVRRDGHPRAINAPRLHALLAEQLRWVFPQHLKEQFAAIYDAGDRAMRNDA